MSGPDLTIRSEDDERVRAVKQLLIYGNHKKDCDRSSEEAPEGVQHVCCSCGWCQVADWASLILL